MTVGYLEIISKSMTEEELFIVARCLHAAYQPFLLDDQVWSLIESTLPGDVVSKIGNIKDSVVGHDVVNDMIMNFYPGEKTVKYHFSKQYFDRENDILGFEIAVKSSRLDIVRVNTKSYAYEIKTELDSLSKLEKQVFDYSLVFEHVIVVVHPSHISKVKQLIPDHVGIITYQKVNGVYSFRTDKTSTRSPYLDYKEQVNSLNSKELEFVLRKAGKKNIPNSRKHRELSVFDKINENKINTLFKAALRERFRTRWSFILDNKEAINPVDVQAFFISQANPYWVYYKNSSKV